MIEGQAEPATSGERLFERPQLLSPAVSVHDAFCVHSSELGAVVALRGLTLEVEQGEVVVVHGPNGAGKTTLLRLLAGRQALTAGRVRVIGGSIGWVDQQPRRVLRSEMLVWRNVALQARLAGVGPAQAREAALAALDGLGLADLGERTVETLSGGQAQRVAVCGAIAHGPKLILADEPCGELDRETADVVYETIRQAGRLSGAAVLVVSHDPGAGRIADRVVRIRDGRVSESTSPGEAETPVVDGQGWMRLPAGAQELLGPQRRVRVAVQDEVIVVRPVDPAPRPVVTAVPVPVAVPRQGSPAAALLRAEGLTRRYPGRSPIAVDLAVGAEELVVLNGRSGAGKSTILEMVTGMSPPDAGTLRWRGEDVDGWSREKRARGRGQFMAVLGQPVVLVETADLMHNLAWARSLRGLAPNPVLAAELIELLDLERLIGRPVVTLSGGERQRVGLARALVTEVPLLVLDEPTSQLDEARASQLSQVIGDRVALGMAVLVATHDPILNAAATSRITLEGSGPTQPPAADHSG